MGNVGVDAIQLVPSDLINLPDVAEAFGKVGVEDTIFVPLLTNILPEVPAVDGYVAVLNVGATPTPAPCKIVPVAAVAIFAAFIVAMITSRFYNLLCYSPVTLNPICSPISVSHCTY